MPNFHKKIKIPRIIKIKCGDTETIIKFEDDPMFFLKACYDNNLFEETEDELSNEDA